MNETVESTVYIVVKLRLRHGANVTPDEVASELDYEFSGDEDVGTVLESEIVGTTDRCPPGI